MIACICKVCCLLNLAHDRGSSTEGWILIVHIVNIVHTINSVFIFLHAAQCVINLSHWYKVNKVIIHNSATLRYV